jgi:hypothetical protein
MNGQVNIEQSAYTEDIDVIDIEKNTSFIDYSKNNEKEIKFNPSLKMS